MNNVSTQPRSSRKVVIWLAIGVFMVFMQVVIGGITRLTDSGLSITEWDPIMGAIPPLNAADWQEAFDKYKTHAKTQFEAIHADMTMSEFKVIFFWEWFHREWARIMGLVFLIPFIYFIGLIPPLSIAAWREAFKKYRTHTKMELDVLRMDRLMNKSALKGGVWQWAKTKKLIALIPVAFFTGKKQLHSKLVKRLGIVIAIAMLAALFGWIMVASGLNTPDYAWVNAYKLSIHLGIGFALFSYLFWTFLNEWKPAVSVFHNTMLKRLITAIIVVTAMQIIFGGWMSGMKAGLAYPSFPDMNGKIIAPVLGDGAQWTTKNLIAYNTNTFAPALIQVLHRFTAYALTVLILYFIFFSQKFDLSTEIRKGIWGLGLMLIVQFLLGVFTLINCKGSIPITLVVLHQAGALVLLAFAIYTTYLMKIQKD